MIRQEENCQPLPASPRRLVQLHACKGVAAGRSSDLQALPILQIGLSTNPGFPVRERTSASMGVRSCLPLRGSPGFPPGSLFGAST
jgi:hypothetical protein